jgi:hypothetical protein
MIFHSVNNGILFLVVGSRLVSPEVIKIVKPAAGGISVPSEKPQISMVCGPRCTVIPCARHI